MIKRQLFIWLAVVMVIFLACQKETSFEGSNEPAHGTLQSDVTGDCLPKTVNGAYSVGVPMVATTNTISVDVNITKTGTYTIGTDTVNGYFFRGTGIFTTLGINTITLRGNGTPFAAGVNNFVVSFDSSSCDIQITVSSPGAGTLVGSPGSCAPITVNGSYSPGTSMGATNTAVVQTNITTAGNIFITTDTIAGIWFSYTGSLATGSNQPITLQANGAIPSGEPTGTKTFTVKFGTSNCTFTVNVAGPSSGTVNCGGATPAGTYTALAELDPVTNTVQISVNVTTIGAYTITTDTVDGPTPNGFWFNGAGTFSSTGNQNVTLAGHGIPAAVGTFTLTVKYGSSTCTFPCTVSAPLLNDYFPRTTNSNWSYEIDDNANDSLLKKVIPNTLSALGNTYNIFMESADVAQAPPFDSSGYYRRNSADYFEYLDLGQAGLDNAQWVEYKFLTDNVAAGTNWTSASFTNAIGGLPITFRLKDSIDKKDVPITLVTSINPSGKIYQNVIVVKEVIQVSVVPGIFFDASGIFGYTKLYYAKGIGLIKVEPFKPDGTPDTGKMHLRRYDIY